MNIAAMDLGTNSIRLDVISLEPKPKVIFRQKNMVRLGQHLFETGELHPDAIKRTLKTLKEFSEICESYHVKDIHAFGTSALRTANNTKDFTEKAKKKYDLKIKVISGKEEAKLIYEGILLDRRAQKKPFGFIDIGGGSTEVGVGDKKSLHFLESFELGAARLKQLYTGAEEQRKQAKKYLKKFPVPAQVPELILGSSGTIKALRDVLPDKHIRKKSLSEFIDSIDGLSAEEISFIPGVPMKRADIILSGAVILEAVMNFLDVKEVRYTKFAMRDGILSSLLSK